MFLLFFLNSGSYTCAVHWNLHLLATRRTVVNAALPWFHHSATGCLDNLHLHILTSAHTICIQQLTQTSHAAHTTCPVALFGVSENKDVNSPLQTLQYNGRELIVVTPKQAGTDCGPQSLFQPAA